MTPMAASRSPQSSISPETRLKLYRTMQESRMLEKRAYDLFMQNLIKGTSHLALGQEAIAAGFGLAMRPEDYTFCTYRGHILSQAEDGMRAYKVAGVQTCALPI